MDINDFLDSIEWEGKDVVCIDGWRYQKGLGSDILKTESIMFHNGIGFPNNAPTRRFGYARDIATNIPVIDGHFEYNNKFCGLLNVEYFYFNKDVKYILLEKM